MLTELLRPGSDIMSDLNMAMDQNQIYLFAESPTWHHYKSKGRAIMSIRKKFWILAALYLTNLWIIWLLTIMMMSKIT